MKNIWLLVFPLLRGAIMFPFNLRGQQRKHLAIDYEQLRIWVEGAWFDIVVLALILLFGVAQWLFSRYEFSENAIVHKHGFFTRSETVIRYSKLASVTGEKPFYLRPFRAVKLFLTCHGSSLSSDLSLLVSRGRYAKFLAAVPDIQNEERTAYSHKPSLLIVLLFSVVFSSSFSGIVYIALFLYQGGQIAQDIMRTTAAQLTETAMSFVEKIIAVPQMAITLGIFLVVSWIISFLFNMLRYINFNMASTRSIIEVNTGLFTLKKFYIHKDKIN